MSATAIVPRFYLYGEPHRAAEARFVHIESLDDRSRPSEWTIRPHAHGDLNHVFHMAEGGGTMRAEQRWLSFAAPCLIVVPAGIVHGFQWQSESTGAVVTLSSAYFARLQRCDEALAPLFRSAAVTALDSTGSSAFAAVTERLMAELGWAAPGHRAVIEAGILDLLVRVLRASGADRKTEPGAPHHQIALVARYRERIEACFRLREPIALQASALRTSPTRLRVACVTVAGRSPMQMLDDRTLLEAQRALLYSTLSIAAIAQIVGFEDAAYFSRFFARHIGVSPRSYRSQHGREPLAE